MIDSPIFFSASKVNYPPGTVKILEVNPKALKYSSWLLVSGLANFEPVN